jgi:membrane glycosyltransferase
MNPLNEEQMWDIIDGIATPDIKIQHEALLKNDVKYKTSFEALMQLQNQLLQLDLEQPPMRFTQNIIDKVAYPVKATIKPDKVLSIFMFTIFCLLVTSIISVIIFNTNSTDITAMPALFMQYVSLTEKIAMGLSNPIIMPLFLMLNAGLIFMALDKWILKNYFQK